MNSFNYQAELQRVIEQKQLAQVFLNGAPTFKVAYLLSANEEYLTFAEVSSSATFAGVMICRLSGIDAVKVSNLYLGELIKQIPGESLHQQAQKTIESIKEFTFDGFLTAFEGTKSIVELVDDNEDTFAGRLIGHDDQVIAMDEFYTEYDRLFARSYVNRSIITRMGVEIPWLRTIALSLADKNI